MFKQRLLPISILHWPRMYENERGEIIIEGRHGTPFRWFLARLIMLPVLLSLLALPYTIWFIRQPFYDLIMWIENEIPGTYGIYDFDQSENPLVRFLGHVYYGLLSINDLYWNLGYVSLVCLIFQTGFVWFYFASFVRTPECETDYRHFHFIKNLLNYMAYPIFRFFLLKKTRILVGPTAIVLYGWFGRKRVFQRTPQDAVAFTNLGHNGRDVYMNFGIKTVRIMRCVNHVQPLQMVIALDYANKLALDPDNNVFHVKNTLMQIENLHQQYQRTDVPVVTIN